MRYAACSWARATIRSASSWAFSMIRPPSWLIRLAASGRMDQCDFEILSAKSPATPGRTHGAETRDFHFLSLRVHGRSAPRERDLQRFSEFVGLGRSRQRRTPIPGDEWLTLWGQYDTKELVIGSHDVIFAFWFYQVTCPSKYDYCYFYNFPGQEFSGQGSFVFYTIWIDLSTSTGTGRSSG